MQHSIDYLTVFARGPQRFHRTRYVHRRTYRQSVVPGNFNSLHTVRTGYVRGRTRQYLPAGTANRMHRRHRASPAVQCCHGRRQIILKEPRMTVCAGEKPYAPIAILPCCSGEKRRHGGSRTLPGEQTTKKISAWTEERNQPFADRPRIVAAAA